MRPCLKTKTKKTKKKKNNDKRKTIKQTKSLIETGSGGFGASLVYITGSRIARATQKDPSSKTNLKRKEEK